MIQNQLILWVKRLTMWLPFEALYSSNLTLATGFQWLM